MTAEQQAEAVEGILSGHKQCAYCKCWQSPDQMKENMSWIVGGFSYLCKQNDLCLSRLWDNVRADRQRAGKAG